MRMTKLTTAAAPGNVGASHDGDEGALGDAFDGLRLGPGEDGEDQCKRQKIEED